MARIKAYSDNILAIKGDFGDKKTKAGIIVKASIGKEEGTVPRWFQVFDVGPDIDWLQEGQWVYVEYGRWTEGFTAPDDRLEEGQKIWKLDPAGCLATSDDKPEDQLNLKAANGIEFAGRKTRD
jgi:hypothetical protein